MNVRDVEAALFKVPEVTTATVEWPGSPGLPAAKYWLTWVIGNEWAPVYFRRPFLSGAAGCFRVLGVDRFPEAPEATLDAADTRDLLRAPALREALQNALRKELARVARGGRSR